MEPLAPKFNPWSACPITFDRRDHQTSIRHGGLAELDLIQSSTDTTYNVNEPVQRASTSGITPLKVVLLGLILDGSMSILQTVS